MLVYRKVYLRRGSRPAIAVCSLPIDCRVRFSHGKCKTSALKVIRFETIGTKQPLSAKRAYGYMYDQSFIYEVGKLAVPSNMSEFSTAKFQGAGIYFFRTRKEAERF